MELLRKLIFYFTCVTLIIVAESKNGMEQNLYPVYLGPKVQINNVGVVPRMLDDSVLNNNSESSMNSQNVQSNVIQSGISIANPNKAVFVNVSRGPSKYHTANIPVNHQRQLSPLRQLTGNEVSSLNNLTTEDQTNSQRHIITAPVNNAPFNSGNTPTFNLLQPSNGNGQDSLTKQVATNLTELTPNPDSNFSLPQLNSFQPSQYLPTNILLNRQLPMVNSNKPAPQPSFKNDLLFPTNKQSPQSSSINVKDRSSYSWYTPQISKSKEPEIDRNSVNPSFNNAQSQPAAPTYFQQPNSNYDLQYLPGYNPEDELSEKQDSEDDLDDYLNSTASFINGSIVTIFALALSLLLLAIITATTVSTPTAGRKKREVDHQEGFTWEVTDMIQCVSRFYCEMEQWDQKYPPPTTTPTSNESARKERFNKDRTPREATNRRKICGKDYRKCPVNFTILRTLYRMFS